MHKILKDETRRKIVLLLNEKGSLSYTDLMQSMGFEVTGLFNYHLKILGDLLAKNEAGQYVLTEKGKLASRFLLEYPEGAPTGRKPTWWRRFWIEITIAALALCSLFFALFFLGYIDSEMLYQGITTALLGVGLAYMVQHILRDVLSKNKKLLVAKFGYIVGGIAIGLTVAYIGVGMALSGYVRYSGERFGPGNSLYGFFWNIGYQIFAIFIAPAIGAVAMYYFGKKRGFKTQNYNPDT